MKLCWTLNTSTSMHYRDFSFLVLEYRLIINWFTRWALSCTITFYKFTIHWHGTFFEPARLNFNRFFGAFFASRFIWLYNGQFSLFLWLIYFPVVIAVSFIGIEFGTLGPWTPEEVAVFALAIWAVFF